MEKFILPNAKEEKTVLKSIRLKQTIMEQLEEISKKTDLSVNRLINECVDFALKNLDKNSIKK